MTRILLEDNGSSLSADMEGTLHDMSKLIAGVMIENEAAFKVFDTAVQAAKHIRSKQEEE